MKIRADLIYLGQHADGLLGEILGMARGEANPVDSCRGNGCEDLGETMREVRARTTAPVATARFAPACERELSGQQVFVACGIGNPRAFVSTVESLGGVVESTRYFRDHHAYTRDEAVALAGQRLPVVVTEKDAVKLEPIWPEQGAPLVVVTIDFEFLDGGDAVMALMEPLGP